MDMKKYSGEHFIKVDDVRDDPIEEQIAVVQRRQIRQAEI